MAVGWAELVSQIGPYSEALAFIYVAEVGLYVGGSAFSLNPGVPQRVLRDVLAPVPEWLGGNRKLLRDGWPQIPGDSEQELVHAALLSCKAMLALGAAIPDGAFEQMQRDFDQRFPAIAETRQNSNPQEFATTDFHVVIEAVDSHATRFGYTGGRPGRDLPIPDPHASVRGKPRSWTNWELVMKNLVRLDLQRSIEAMFAK